MWAAKEAPSSVMRDIAAIALSRGLSQGDLARKLGVSTIGVSRHFEREKPHAETMQKYALALELPSKYLGLVNGEPIQDWLVNASMEKMARTLNLKAASFTEGTVKAVCEHLERLDASSQERIARAVLLAEYRESVGIVDEAANQFAALVTRFGAPFVTFWLALAPAFDLSERVVRDTNFTLVDLWTWAGFVFAGEATADGDALVEYAIWLLQKRDIDTLAMRQTLERHKRQFIRGLEIGTVDLVRDPPLAVEPLKGELHQNVALSKTHATRKTRRKK